MVGLILDLKPLRIKQLQKKFQRESDIARRKMNQSKKVVIENPIKSKFQID